MIEPEQTLSDTIANMWRGAEAVGGRLKITNHRVIFNSHMFNLQTGLTEIPLVDIAQVTPVNTFGLVPNGLCITLKSGIEHRFVVWGRNKLITIIRANMPLSL